VARARVESRVDGAGTSRPGRPDRPVVEVTVEGPGGTPVLRGTFHCAVPEGHVLAKVLEPEGGER
jgi:hypothetical protein